MTAAVDYVDINNNSIDSDNLDRYDYVIVWISTCCTELLDMSCYVDLIKKISLLYMKEMIILDAPIRNNRNPMEEALSADGRNRFSFISAAQLYDRFGVNRLKDPDFYRRWDMPYSDLGYREHSNLIASFIIGHRNERKKCVVLDCDNVLWNGILDEEGIEKIDVTPICLSLQKALKQLKEEGVLLAICSKNDLHRVEGVFKYKSGMVLHLEDFASIQVGWGNKDKGIECISEELNISLSSTTFVDDSISEINWINRKFPEITCILFDKPTIENADFRYISFFNILHITQEDRTRTNAIHASKSDRALKSSGISYGEYLKTLEREIVIQTAKIEHIDRIHQLIHRTNQFNINCIRYSKSDITGFVLNNNTQVDIVKYRDKLFDYGIVGTVIVTTDNLKHTIKSFLLSCKVLGRDVETDLLAYYKKEFQNKGINQVCVNLKKLSKNIMAYSFFTSLNLISDSSGDHWLTLC